MTEQFKAELFIYQVIDSGMVSYLDVKNGAVSLAELLNMLWYLEMKSDVEYTAIKKAEKGGK
ncbi:hypothetical protein SAMN02745671_01169 [Anaerovibrio lipolyticus DSM 3074]|uniref:Uncharacterized protein n=1 Tax=Anaerovibrio lipolyticus DSM 3074 TaxID=1120997 RepID=A0A1M6CLB2_9FIRM|nr:hypothetical protein [Anaerovibrio lipolyticus]SHI61825.1 hypothetical protein SAMN02745671_01169 [Anaerovibrio lipolyticus DSM 3074]